MSYMKISLMKSSLLLRRLKSRHIKILIKQSILLMRQWMMKTIPTTITTPTMKRKIPRKPHKLT